MSPLVRWFLGLAAVCWVESVVAFAHGNPHNAFTEQDPEYITRDVCIIGGGSSGTYAAIRLQDSGKSVVVVEKAEELGGHTSTYIDPATNKSVDYGVIIFHDLDIVKDYFDRLDVAYQKATLGAPGDTYYANIRTGQLFSNYTPPIPTPALELYAKLLLNYTGLDRGFYFPTPVPGDLLLPFGAFVDKYGLGNAVRTIANFGQGLGTLAKQTTLYVMKNFGLGILQHMQGGFLEAASKNNHEIYEKARRILEPNVLTESRVISTSRNATDGVVVFVQSPSGVKVIKASKLLVTIPPKLENLVGFDLDNTELSLFGQFLNTGYYTSLVRNVGLPENTSSVENIDPSQPYDLAELPGPYSIMATSVPGLFAVKYGSSQGIPIEDVKADIIASIKRLPISTLEDQEPEFVRFESHTPFELTVRPEAIEAGFYEDLYGLQGHRDTFYTGAAFHTHDSSLLWQFTEKLLPKLGVNAGDEGDGN